MNMSCVQLMSSSSSAKSLKAVVLGVGAVDGLGAALAIRFARAGKHVVIAGRTQAKLDQVVKTIEASGGSATAVAADVTSEADTKKVFDAAFKDDEKSGPADLVVYNAGSILRAGIAETDPAGFESMWRVNSFGGFLTARESAQRLGPLGRGTVIFTGASGSLRGNTNFSAFGASKAALRAVAQSFAREYGPKNIHVAHVVVDGVIDGERSKGFAPGFVQSKGEDGALHHEDIAEAYWSLYQQKRSAWTHEMDLRPYKESF